MIPTPGAKSPSIRQQFVPGFEGDLFVYELPTSKIPDLVWSHFEQLCHIHPYPIFYHKLSHCIFCPKWSGLKQVSICEPLAKRHGFQAVAVTGGTGVNNRWCCTLFVLLFENMLFIQLDTIAVLLHFMFCLFFLQFKSRCSRNLKQEYGPYRRNDRRIASTIINPSIFDLANTGLESSADFPSSTHRSWQLMPTWNLSNGPLASLELHGNMETSGLALEINTCLLPPATSPKPLIQYFLFVQLKCQGKLCHCPQRLRSLFRSNRKSCLKVMAQTIQNTYIWFDVHS